MSRDCVHGSLARSCELCYLQTEIVRLKAEVVRDHSLCIGENEALAAERDRLVDGIRGHSEEWAFVTEGDVVSGAGMESNDRLWSLLDVAGDDHLCECGHTLQAVGPGGPYRCVMGCKYQAARDRTVEAGDDPPVPYRALEGSEGGEDDR